MLLPVRIEEDDTAKGFFRMLSGPLCPLDGRRFEATQGIVRGTAGSIASAAAFGEYFPNPVGAVSAPYLV